MPSVSYAPGAVGSTSRNFWRNGPGKHVLTTLDEDTRARITAVNDGDGANPTALNILGCSSSVPTPNAEGAFTPGPAYELNVSSPDAEEPPGSSFWIGSSALTIDPLKPPSRAANATAALSASSRQPRTPVQLLKTFTENDNPDEFIDAMDEKLELQNWEGASDAQVAHQIFANLDPDIAAGLAIDGARAMPKAAIYAMLKAMPRAEASTIMTRLALMKEKCTDREPFAAFLFNLYARIVRAHGYKSIALWIAKDGEKNVCQTIIGILAHACPPRLDGVMTSQMRALVAATTTLDKLTRARKTLLEYGSSNMSLNQSADASSQHANVFNTTAQTRETREQPATTTTGGTSDIQAMREQIEELKKLVEARPTKYTRPTKYESYMGKCNHCDGEDSLNGGPPGEHLRRDCPRR